MLHTIFLRGNKSVRPHFYYSLDFSLYLGIAREKLLADQLICYDSPAERREQTDVEGHE